jgi:hypothetical protein
LKQGWRDGSTEAEIADFRQAFCLRMSEVRAREEQDSSDEWNPEVADPI